MNYEKDKLDSHVWVDFNNTDRLARVRLNCIGIIEALNWQGIRLVEGLEIGMYQDDRNIEIPGIVQRNEEENIWVAKVDWLKVITENSISI